jgi:hypothetical protein
MDIIALTAICPTLAAARLIFLQLVSYNYKNPNLADFTQ